MSSSYELLGLGLSAAGMAAAWVLLRGKASSTYADLLSKPVAKVSKLYVYPVKSCHRIEVESIQCLKRGLKYDRTFVVVGKDGYFMSQRAYPSMALIQPRLDLTRDYGDDNEGLSLFLTAPGMEELQIKVPPLSSNNPTDEVKIWQTCGEGVFLGEEAGAWFSKFLEKEGCRVYYMTPQNRARFVRNDPRWIDIAKHDDQTSFSDCAALLMASEASMDLLNSKLDEKLEIERFRPNIIVSGCSPHDEDKWPEVRIGDDLLLRNLKPCTRCKMTTVDQEKGVFSKGEPMNTLSKYRFYSMVYGTNDKRFSESPMFGCHYCISKEGRIQTNDSVYTAS